MFTPPTFRKLTRRQTLMALGTAAWGCSLHASRVVAADSDQDWPTIAENFLLDRNLTYLNTGSLGSTPKPVLESCRLVEQKLEANPVEEGFGPVLREAELVTGKLAELIGCTPAEVTVTRNTTEGMNFVAEGLELKPGDRVLTSNNEHGGGLGAWRFLKKYRRIEIDVAEISSPPDNADRIVENFRTALRPETRVLMCSHVTFSNGVLMPISRLSELAHQHGCAMVVDGAQSTGGIPVNVQQLGCDAFVSSGHKFLLGPKGTGLLYIRQQSRDRIRPMQLDDGGGYYTAIRGTNNMIGAIGLGAAIDWLKGLGHDAVFSRLMTLRNSLYEVLKQNHHVRICCPPPKSPLASHLVCFRVPDRGLYAKLKQRFAVDRVIVKDVGINDIDFRLSTHLYNTEADIEQFARSLREGLA